MTTAAIYLRKPTAQTATLRARFGPLFARIAEGDLEREQSRVFPHEQVRWLGEAGLGTLRIPEEYGGLGASLEQTFTLLADLGEADANVSHIWRNHLAFVEDRLNAPVSETNDNWIKRFLARRYGEAGASPHVNVGCRQEVVLAGRATDVDGGPSETSSYECWFGCARTFGCWVCT